jgi:hypothetical protein
MALSRDELRFTTEDSHFTTMHLFATEINWISFDGRSSEYARSHSAREAMLTRTGWAVVRALSQSALVDEDDSVRVMQRGWGTVLHPTRV